MSVIDEHDLVQEDEHEPEIERAPLRAPTPTTLDDDEGRGINPWVIFGIIGIIVVVLLGILAFYIHARISMAQTATTRSIGSQTSPLDTTTGQQANPNTPWLLPKIAKPTPTPFPTQQACLPGSTPVMTVQGLACRRTAFAGAQQPGTTPGGTLPCGSGTVDTVVQTPTGPQHECMITDRNAAYTTQQRGYGNGYQNGYQGGYQQQPPPQPRIIPTAPPTPTPLPNAHVAFASPPPRVTNDEQQAQYDIAAQYGSGSSYSYNNDPPASPSPDPADPPQQQSGEFVTGARYVRPQSVAQIDATSVITMRLLSRVVSDLGGTCLGITQGDLLDSHTHTIVVVPDGTKVLCQVDPNVRFGIGRVAISLQELVFPDGREFLVGGLPGSDGTGASGVDGNVNNHGGAVRGAAGYLILATALESALTARSQGSVYGQPSFGGEIAGAAGGTLSQITNETIRRNLQQAPTVSVDPGKTVQFIVTRDLPLVPYYQQEPQ
jgi:type IV secretory pathway VirB10-like protein